MWKPPNSNGILIQEEYWPNEWKILTCCLLLNLTSIKQVRPMIKKFFTLYPDANSMIDSNETELQNLLKPLGFWRKRVKTLKRFSEEYLTKDWLTAKDLYGCGKYADDCYQILCKGKWQDVEPKDHALNEYLDFLLEHYGGDQCQKVQNAAK